MRAFWNLVLIFLGSSSWSWDLCSCVMWSTERAFFGVALGRDCWCFGIGS